jgi:hypothetical protein
LANSTWYCMGTNQKLMVEAKGQIFQLLIIIYWYFSLKFCTPFFHDYNFRSVTIWLIGKKKAKRIGAKTNWSIAIDAKTLTVFETLGKTAAWTRGSSLQYQRWRQGPKYPKPMVKKSRLRFQLNYFFSKTELTKHYWAEWGRLPSWKGFHLWWPWCGWDIFPGESCRTSLFVAYLLLSNKYCCIKRTL